jgi:hypothetical protein
MENQTAKTPFDLILAGARGAAVGQAGLEAMEMVERVLSQIGEDPKLTVRDRTIIRATFAVGYLHSLGVRLDGEEGGLN